MIDLDAFIAAITLVIGHSLWQGAVIAAALAIALAMTRRSSANLRYALACAALALAVTLPVITAIATGPSAAPAVTDPGSATPLAGPAPSAAPPPAPATARHMVGAVTPDVVSTVFAARYWIFAAWLLGVVTLSAIHLAGYRRVLSLRASGIGAPAHWQPMADALARSLGLARRVRVSCSRLVDVPAVVGWLSPLVLVPASAVSGLRTEDLRFLIAHELAHVRRHDYAVNVVQMAAETLFFYHPAVWWMSRRIRLEREHCCDDLAVAACGDRMNYARALVRLEELRTLTPGFAMRADGGSLAWRVRRLLGGSTMQTSSGSARLGALVAIAVIVAGTAVTFTANPHAQSDRLDYEAAESQFALEGDWELERWRSDRVIMRFDVDSRRNHMNVSMDFEPAEFAGLEFGKDDEFTLTREAGVVYLRGDFRGSGDDARGAGDFGFVPDAGFEKELGKRVSGSLDDRELFVLAVEDVGIAFVEEMAELGYDNIDDDELVAMAIHGVTPEFARAVQERELRASVDDLIAMRIHDVTEEFMDEMRDEGLEYRTVDDLVAWRIHDVDVDFVHEMRDLDIGRIDPDDFVAMRIHDVTPDFAREMIKRYERVRVDDLVAMRIHDIDDDFVRELEDAGYRGLSADELTSWKIHGVSGEFIHEMESLGYEHLSANDLVSFRIHGVTPKFIHELADLGYKNVDADELVAMRIHNVTPRFIKKMRDKGHDLSIEDLIKIKIHGIRL